MALFSPRSGALVIQTAYMGDVILTTPLLTALAETHGPVDVVTTPASAPLIETHPAVRSVLPYDKRGADRGWHGLRRLAADLRRRRYEVTYLPHRSWRSASLVFFARIPQRVGFADSPAASLYTRRIPRPLHRHETARLVALAGLPPDASVPPVSLGLTERDEAEAERWLRDQGISGRFVCLAPGSIWGTKRWPYYALLAERLALPVVAIGGPTDRALGEEIEVVAPGRTVSACGHVGPRTSAALIARAAALVTNDSAPLHLASAVGTPQVAIFGPTVPSFGFGPLGPDDISLGHDDLLCRPCSPHGPATCPLDHHRCMRDLSVERVAQALATVMARSDERRALRSRN